MQIVPPCRDTVVGRQSYSSGLLTPVRYWEPVAPMTAPIQRHKQAVLAVVKHLPMERLAQTMAGFPRNLALRPTAVHPRWAEHPVLPRD